MSNYIKDAISQITNELFDQRKISISPLYKPELKERAADKVSVLTRIAEELAGEFNLVVCADCLEAVEKSDSKKGICNICYESAAGRVEQTLINIGLGK